MSFQTRLLSSNDTSIDPGMGQDDTPSDALPDLLQFNSLDPQRYPFLLSSTASRENNTQYDILLACPRYQLTLNADKTLDLSAGDSGVGIDNSAGFLDNLENLYLAESRQDNLADEGDSATRQSSSENLPFTGGWFVYLSYEIAEEIEPCLSLPGAHINQPRAVAVRCPAAIIIDKANGRCIAIAEDSYSELLDDIEEDFDTIQNLTRLSAMQPQADQLEKVSLLSLHEADPAPYLAQVEKIKSYIIDGDIFQANLSRPWRATLDEDIEDADLFRSLSANNPSSFAALATLSSMSIISSSPERLVSLRDNIVETRPIAGTRPRHSDQLSDEALAKELLDHPKEQAEHIMLIDLERNDLGRVCKPGSIEVDELMTLESWEHVHHIVSNVRGELREDKSPIDVLRAVFPGGTITGCPKVRCIEILAEMEQEARGAYTGSLGYINLDGSMDFNILIRTMVRQGREITFRAGGGIVSDSIAERELEETRAKAKGLLKIFSVDHASNDPGKVSMGSSKETDLHEAPGEDEIQ